MNMKFLVSILLISLLSFALGFYLPWWSIAIAAFAVSALIAQSPRKSFVTGFAGVFLLWFIVSFVINSANGSLLAAKIAAVLPLAGSPFLLMLFTAFIGGLVGGMASLTAGLMVRK